MKSTKDSILTRNRNLTMTFRNVKKYNSLVSTSPFFKNFKDKVLNTRQNPPKSPSNFIISLENYLQTKNSKDSILLLSQIFQKQNDINIDIVSSFIHIATNQYNHFMISLLSFLSKMTKYNEIQNNEKLKLILTKIIFKQILNANMNNEVINKFILLIKDENVYCSKHKVLITFLILLLLYNKSVNINYLAFEEVIIETIKTNICENNQDCKICEFFIMYIVKKTITHFKLNNYSNSIILDTKYPKITSINSVNQMISNRKNFNLSSESTEEKSSIPNYDNFNIKTISSCTNCRNPKNILDEHNKKSSYLTYLSYINYKKINNPKSNVCIKNFNNKSKTTRIVLSNEKNYNKQNSNLTGGRNIINSNTYLNINPSNTINNLIGNNYVNNIKSKKYKHSIDNFITTTNSGNNNCKKMIIFKSKNLNKKKISLNMKKINISLQQYNEKKNEVLGYSYSNINVNNVKKGEKTAQKNNIKNCQQYKNIEDSIFQLNSMIKQFEKETENIKKQI